MTQNLHDFDTHADCQPSSDGFDSRCARRCAIVMPMVKALPSKRTNFKYEVVGVASDERRDLQGQINKVALARPEVLEYLVRCGVVDWNHLYSEDKGGDVIGKVLGASFMDAATAASKGYAIVPPALELRTGIHNLPKTLDLAPDDLKRAHYMIEVEAPLFMSLFGVATPIGKTSNAAGESGAGVVPLVLDSVCLTDRPINMNAQAAAQPFVMAKSLSSFFGELGEGERGIRNGVARESYELPMLVFEAPEMNGMAKALACTGVVPQGGTMGGDAIKAGNDAAADKRHCSACFKAVSDTAKHCDECGAEITQLKTENESDEPKRIAKAQSLRGHDLLSGPMSGMTTAEAVRILCGPTHTRSELEIICRRAMNALGEK